MPRRSAERFIGRAGELSTLLGALEQARAGPGGLAIVTGEAGMGKTRLVDRFAMIAQEQGAAVLRGWGVPVAGAGVAYAALASLLRDAVDDRPELSEFVRRHAAHALHLLPPEAAPEPAPPLTGELAQLRLLDAVRAALAELARSAGALVAIIEDIHWVDQSSGEALAHLAGPDQPPGLLVVLTYRPHDLPARHPLFGVLRELERRPRADRIDLSPFVERELAEQAEQLLGAEPSSDVLADLVDRSGGNPFFAEELIASWQRGTAGVPVTVAEMLLAELDPLPEPVRRLVRTAAAAGRQLHPGLLAKTLDLDPSTLAEQLRAAAEAGVLVPVTAERGGRAPAIAFRHELLREAVYATLLPGEREPVHLGLAQALAAAPELAVHGRTAGELAYHYQLAGEPALALASAAQAVAQARGMGALAEAAGYGLRCLELWDLVPDAEQVAGLDRVELLMRLAEDSLLSGRRSGESWARRALELVDARVDPARHALVAARLARYEVSSGRPDAALQTMTRAVRVVAQVPEGAVTVRVTMDHAQILTSLDRCEDAHREALLARELARRHGDRVVEVEAGGVIGVSMVMAGRWVEGLDEVSAAVCAAAELGSEGRAPEAYAQVLMDEAFSLHWTGFPDRALDAARRAVEVTRGLGLERSFGDVMVAVAATAAVTLGQLDAAERLLGDLTPSAVVRFAGCVGEARTALALARGDLDAAAAVLRRHPPRVDAQIGLCLTGAAEVALGRGDIDEARRLCAQMIVDLSALDLTWPLGRLTAVALQAEALAADVARLAGDHAALAAAMARTEELVATCGRMMEVLCGQSGRAHPDALAWSAIGRAWAAHAHGAAEVDLWASAVEATEAAGMRLVAADLRLWAAQAELGAGTRAAAADLVAAALATAREAGAHGIARRAEELIQRARLVPDPGHDAAVDVSTRARLGLTDRELQVLRLLADGRTNREIGEALFMSPKTASVHVTSLLRKLDVPGRREAGRLARQLGLR